MSVHHAWGDDPDFVVISSEDEDEDGNQRKTPVRPRKQDHVTTNWDQNNPDVERQNSDRLRRAANRDMERQRKEEIARAKKQAKTKILDEWNTFERKIGNDIQNIRKSEFHENEYRYFQGERRRNQAKREQEEERLRQERARAKANINAAYARLAEKWKAACPGYRNGKSPTELKHDLRDLRIEENDELRSGTISKRFGKMMLETHPDKGKCPPNETLGIYGSDEDAKEECVRLMNAAQAAKDNMKKRCFV